MEIFATNFEALPKYVENIQSNERSDIYFKQDNTF